MKPRMAAVFGAGAVGLALTATPAGAATAAVHGGGAESLGTVSWRTAADGARAAHFAFKVSKAKCTSTTITFTARTSESGISGVQQFTQTAREQELHGARWVDITGTSSSKSAKFPNDPRNFYYQRDWRATHSADGALYRVVWKGFYLDGGGAAIYRTKPIPVYCL